MAVNVAVFAWQVLGGTDGGASVGGGGTLDAFVLVPGASAWWTSLTYAFLHDPGGILHILFNMLFLWVFGPVVEDRLGRVGFAGFYLAGAAAAGWAHAWSGGGPVIGASGAVSGVTGAALALFPRARVRTFVLFFIIGVYMIPAWVFIAIAVGRDLLPVLLGRASRIAYEAHLGGYAYGLAVCVTLLATRAIPREPYDLFSLTRQAKRRRELKAAIKDAEAERQRRIERVESKPEDPETEAIAAGRAAVSTAIAEGRLDDAGDAYASLVEHYGERDGAATLSRKAQYTLAGHLYRSGRAELAAEAFRRYLYAFPSDAERGEIALLLGRLERSLGRAAAAEAMLREAVSHLTDPAHLDAARRELDELRAATTEGG